MIILEGPDGGGKTTLAARLSDELGWPIAPKVVSSDTEALVDLQQWVDHNLDAGFQNAIFDRHRLISEPIYGPVLRGEPAEGFDNAAWLMSRQSMLRMLNPIVIWCLPSPQQVRLNITEDPENRVVAPYISQIYWLYFNAMTQWPCAPSFRYDFTEDSAYWLITQVRKAVGRYL